MINLITMKKTFEELSEQKFISPAKFCEEIENIVKRNPEFNYIEAIISFCEEKEIEIDTISKLITKPLKEKIKRDAIELNYMKKTSRAKLPL
jgi:DNA-binding transcriptional regulator YhcF (GntR family)